MAVQIIVQAVKALAMVARDLIGNGLQLRVHKFGRIEFRLFARHIFVLHLVAKNRKGLGLDHRILILHFIHSLSVNRFLFFRSAQKTCMEMHGIIKILTMCKVIKENDCQNRSFVIIL